MPGERSAAADLDVVWMGPDRQHALLLAQAARVHGPGQQQDLLDEFLRGHRPEQQPVDAALDGLPHEGRALIGGCNQGRDPAVLVLDFLQQVEAARHHRIDDHQIEVLRRDQLGGGRGVGGKFQARDRQVLENVPGLLEGGFVAVDKQDAQPLLGHPLDDAQSGMGSFRRIVVWHGCYQVKRRPAVTRVSRLRELYPPTSWSAMRSVTGRIVRACRSTLLIVGL